MCLTTPVSSTILWVGHDDRITHVDLLLTLRSSQGTVSSSVLGGRGPAFFEYVAK